MIRRATRDDLAALRHFHVSNHLEETCHFPGEREHQVSELELDFPQLYSAEVFARGSFWIATNEDGDVNGTEKDSIVGCIGLLPDERQPRDITWLNTFSVATAMRGRRIGSQLLKTALGAVRTNKVRLVTLGGHSQGSVDIMGRARSLYEKNGFVLYRRENVPYGDSTTIDLMYYEKTM